MSNKVLYMTGCCAQNKTDGPHDDHTEVRTKTLSLGGQLFIWSARRWLIAGQKKERIQEVLAHPYHAAKCPDAAQLLDEMMSIVAVSSFRPVTIRCLHCPVLDKDEWLLIQAVRKLQTGNEEDAAEVVDAFIRGALAKTFLRVTALYASSLLKVGKPITRANFLRIVENQNYN
mgnify:CR=1 FL=1